jgi:hypothetical protein
MQIFYNIAGNRIVTYTHGMWQTPGEYSTPGHACIECACDPAFYPVAVDELGEPTPITVAGVDGNVYRSAVVQFAPEAE